MITLLERVRTGYAKFWVAGGHIALSSLGAGQPQATLQRLSNGQPLFQRSRSILQSFTLLISVSSRARKRNMIHVKETSVCRLDVVAQAVVPKALTSLVYA